MTLQDHAHEMGIELNDAQVAAFRRFQVELLDWNQRMNLTSITDPAEIETKHFLDSLSCLLALPHIDRRPLAAWLASSPKAVDIGSGAGLPGLALKIVWPGLRLTLLDATAKKCRFLEHVAGVLGLADVTVVQARAEDFGQHAGRIAFDLALARAVSRLPTLLEYGLPLLKRGGWFVIQKGRDAAGGAGAVQAGPADAGRQPARRPAGHGAGAGGRALAGDRGQGRPDAGRLPASCGHP